MSKLNKKIIKEQNIAAKSGRYISKSMALLQIAKREADAKNVALKGKK